MQFHMLALFSGISPSFQAARALSPPPAQNLLQKAPPFRDTVFPVSLSQTLSVLPPTKKIEGFARDDDTRRMRFPHTLSLHDARDIHSLHCHFERSREILLALCSSLPLSRKASNFTLSHIRRYTGVQERSRASLGMTVAEMAFSKHIRCTLREINPFPPYRHFEHSEKSSLHSALSCSFRKRFPLFRCHTYNAIPVCKKDPSASLGMTIRE